MPIFTGEKLGPYEILAPLGAGGMGEVYRARDSRLGRDVAIKVLPASFAADPDRLRRFELEARATGMLNHPNILAVYDIGTHEGAPYLVTELLEGDTLRGHIPLPRRKTIEYAQQIANGLAAAHAKGVTHRDLKPENIFITNDGHVKILDFGLAKVTSADATQTATLNVTAPGTAMGTAGYMSPEQVRGQAIDQRSDIFSLGVILYEMLSGQRAFQGDSAVEAMNAILKSDPPPLPDASFDRLIRHCLEKNPEERLQSARDLRFYLDTLSSPSQAPAGPAIQPVSHKSLAPDGRPGRGDHSHRLRGCGPLSLEDSTCSAASLTHLDLRPGLRLVCPVYAGRPVRGLWRGLERKSAPTVLRAPGKRRLPRVGAS